MKKRVDYIFEGAEVEAFLSKVEEVADEMGIDYDIIRDEEVSSYEDSVN